MTSAPPVELTFSPDGGRLAFTLTATVADTGSFVPSDIYVVDAGRGATPTQLTGGAWSDYMAGRAVGQTDRFKAAVAMSVVSNYVSYHLTSEVWWYDHAILGGGWTIRRACI